MMTISHVDMLVTRPNNRYDRFGSSHTAEKNHAVSRSRRSRVVFRGVWWGTVGYDLSNDSTPVKKPHADAC
jgi:hypothetical protein